MMRTGCIIAASGKRHYISADGCALLRDVILVDVLGSDECCESACDGELLEEHVDDEAGDIEKRLPGVCLDG